LIEDRETAELPLHAEIRRWKRAREEYFETARWAEKLYSADHKDERTGGAKLNLFWSIVNTLKPALYAQPPRAMVSRRYQNRNITAHIAAQLLERCTVYQVEQNGYDSAVSRSIDDYLVAGQGCVWVRYEPVFESEVSRVPVFEQPQGPMEGPDEPMEQPVYVTQDGQPVDPQQVKRDDMQPVDPQQVKRDDMGYYIDGEPVETLQDERVVVDYIHWSDLLFEPARTWAEVRKVARKTHITKREFQEKFGTDVYNSFIYSQEKAETEIEKEVKRGRICVYEVWDKDAGKVTWIAEGYNEILKESEPYLEFDGFFPCPEPLFSTLSATGLLPRPDICFYEDQQDTLNQLCTKAQDIAKYIKVITIGDAAEPGLVNMLSAKNGSHISIANYGKYAANGGIKTAYEVLSMAEHAAMLTVLHDAIEREKQQVYDITGISDIVRGVSNASETLGAQEIKSQYAQSRIAARQRKVAKYCRDLVHLIAQVIKNHFQPETIVKMAGVELEMAGVELDEDIQEFIFGAIDLLRKNADSDFKVEIETDSTKFTDIVEARQSAVELTNALGGLFNSLLPYAESIPQLVPVISELTLFTARQFEAGREVYGKLESALTEMLKTVEENKQRAVEQQQAEVQGQQAQAQPQQEAPPDNTEVLAQLQLKAQELQAKTQVEAAKIQSKEAVEAAKIQSKEAIEAAKIQADMQRADADMLHKTIQAGVKADADVRRASMKPRPEYARGQ